MLVFRNTNVVRTLVFEFELILCYQVVRKAYLVFLFILHSYIYMVIELIRRIQFQGILTIYMVSKRL